MGSIGCFIVNLTVGTLVYYFSGVPMSDLLNVNAHIVTYNICKIEILASNEHYINQLHLTAMNAQPALSQITIWIWMLAYMWCTNQLHIAAMQQKQFESNWNGNCMSNRLLYVMYGSWQNNFSAKLHSHKA